jgi:phosphoribosyl 1,2-cyclic phosphodiesterase
MSPPLFPVRVRDLPCRLTVHEVPCGTVRIGPFTIDSALVCHPGPTTGFRISTDRATLAYLPDHEPALGLRGAFAPGGWTSGFSLAAGADLLIHDAQYDDREYETRAGWGHSTIRRAIEFAALAEVGRLVLFHHDPRTTTPSSRCWCRRPCSGSVRPSRSRRPWRGRRWRWAGPDGLQAAGATATPSRWDRWR